jgi:LmbE family N-acetylglucosaminyl deacetylase
MKLLGMDNILCLSPHPDDTEFSMAGTILKHDETKFTNVVFSTGSVYDSVTDKIRWQECKDYWKGKDNIKIEFIADCLSRYSEEEWIVTLEKQLNIRDYDCIFLPCLADTHYEHRIVHNIGMAISRVTNISVIEYRSPSSLDKWVPNLFIEIDKDILDEKTTRLRAFESQTKAYFDKTYLDSFHRNLNALKKGIKYCEQFRTTMLYK